MKYGELPSLEFCNKLASVSFRSPRKDLAVYQYLKTVRPLAEYVEKERVKLVEKYCIPIEGNEGRYTTTPEYREKFLEVLEMEIDEEIKPLGLTADDFGDGECTFPENKYLWMNAAELETALGL